MLEEMNITPLFSHERTKTPHILSVDFASKRRTSGFTGRATTQAATTQAAPTRVDEYVGWKLRSQRQKLGLTVLHVARVCRIPPAEWAAYEAGDRRPSARLLLTMALALEVPLSYFFEGL
jgi:hypothetical protein